MSTIKEKGLERIFANSSAISILNNLRKEFVHSKKASNKTYDVLKDFSTLLKNGKIDTEHHLAYYIKSSGNNKMTVATHLYIKFMDFFDENTKNEIQKNLVKVCNNEKIENEQTEKMIDFIQNFMFLLHQQ